MKGKNKMVETAIIRIRNRTHLNLTFKNACKKLERLAIEKKNWKLMERYDKWALAYESEARTYNECLKILGEKPEETDEIADSIINH